MSKLTEWFPGDVKPVRPGVYQYAFFGKDAYGYAYWNGKLWLGSYSGLAENVAIPLALEDRSTNSRQHCPWRGLAFKP